MKNSTTATKKMMLRFVLSQGSVTLDYVCGLPMFKFNVSEQTNPFGDGSNFAADSANSSFEKFISDIYTRIKNNQK